MRKSNTVEASAGTVVVPTFIKILAACKAARELGIREYSNGRVNKLEFQGALPKRKGMSRVLKRIRNQEWLTASECSRPAERMLCAAYDQGLLDEHDRRDRARA